MDTTDAGLMNRSQANLAEHDARLGVEEAMAAPENPGTPHRQSVVLSPGTGRRIALGEAQIVTLKAVAGDSAGTLSAFEVALAPATAGPPLHLHRTWDEAFYVLDGEMTFHIAGREHLASAGSFVFVPRGILHTFWNASAAPAKQLIVFTPAGIEAYFEEVTRVLADGGEDALEAAEAVMEKHDMIVPPDTRPAYGTLTAADRQEA